MTSDETFRAEYGEASLSPTKPVTAGSFGTWTITYTVGRIGMDDGGRLKIATNVSSDWGPPQFDDPTADNYCSVRTSGDASVDASYDPQGYERPWRNTIDVRVFDGALGKGETITITLGDRTHGSMGIQAQSFPENGFRFVPLLDAFETGKFVEIPDALRLDIVGGSAERLRAVVPSNARPGEAISVSVRAEDYWGNVASDYNGTVHVGAVDDREFEAESVEASDGIAHASVEVRDPGIHRFRVKDEAGSLTTTTNPIICREEPSERVTYWGDIHGQSGETVGTGTIQEYFDFAIEKAFLDFASHAGNDFQITDEFWSEIEETIRAYHDPGSFVTFLCYEWSANTPNGGDHNVYFRDDEADINRSSNWQVTDGADRYRGTCPVEDLYEHYEGRDDVLIVPHRGGRPATLDAVDPELTPFVEILSVWGVFEWFGQEALERGYPVGFVAGSDDHTGRLGASYPTNEADWAFPIKGGLMAVQAESLTRNELWKAFVEQRCYGTTGARILLDVAVDGSPMGSEVIVDETPHIEVDVQGTAPLQEVDLFRGSERLRTRSFDEGEGRVEFRWSGARSRSRHKIQDWSGGLSVDKGRIAEVDEFGFDHPKQGVTEKTPTDVRWDGTTAGNYQGIRVRFDSPDDAVVSFATGPVQRSFTVEELRHHHVLDAGPFGKQLEIRPVGRSDTLDTSLEFEDPSASRGTHPYYVRVRQEDGELAWSSPVFVTIE